MVVHALRHTRGARTRAIDEPATPGEQLWKSRQASADLGSRLLAVSAPVLLNGCGLALDEVLPRGPPRLGQGHLVGHGFVQGREFLRGGVRHPCALDLLALHPVFADLAVPLLSAV